MVISLAPPPGHPVESGPSCRTAHRGQHGLAGENRHLQAGAGGLALAADARAECPVRNEVPVKMLSAAFQAWKAADSRMERCGHFTAELGQEFANKLTPAFRRSRAPPDRRHRERQHRCPARCAARENQIHNEWLVRDQGAIVRQVAGFDDADPAAWPAYALTTCAQPAEDMAEATVGLLVGRIADPSAPPGRVVPGRLVLRSSVRRAAAANAR